MRRIVAAILSTGILAACTQLGLNYSSLEVDNKPAPMPAITATSVSEWEGSKDATRAAFSEYLYGSWPTGLSVNIGQTRITDPNYFGGLGILEETPITLGDGAGARTFHLAVAYPKAALEQGKVPVIISQNFSNNCPVFGSTELTRPDGRLCDLDLWMAAEDFAFYTHEVPGCFYRLGTRNEEKGITSGVHTPTFDIDENAMKTGMGLLAFLAISELNGYACT